MPSRLSRPAAKKFLAGLKGWRLKSDTKSIRKEFLMKDFVAAVKLIDLIKDKAQADKHHPDIHLTGYRHLAIELSTHELGGLSEKDFILAAQIEKLPKRLKAIERRIS